MRFGDAFRAIRECEQVVESQRQQRAPEGIYSWPFAPASIAQQSSHGRSQINLEGEPYERDSRLDEVPRKEEQRSVQH